MRVLTLNLNSHTRTYQREALEKKICILAEYIQKYQLDLIALQECGQTSAAQCWEKPLSGSFHSCDSGIVIKEDNAAAILAKRLAQTGIKYYWTWGGVKQGYGKYDEGLAVFSQYPIRETDFFTVSRQAAFDNWKTRKVLGISVQINGQRYWFYNAHLGWWHDVEEPLRDQIEILHAHLLEKEQGKKEMYQPVICSCKAEYRISKEEDGLSHKKPQIILMGDFNSPSDVVGEGYEKMQALGWKDSWFLAEKKDDGITVPGSIDGWEEKRTKGMRIDYIWMRQEQKVISSTVLFSGRREPVISDHFGVMSQIGTFVSKKETGRKAQ